jgi:ribA/ribD-fused uncharacterized protein
MNLLGKIMSETANGFRGNYTFLSNMSPSPIVFSFSPTLAVTFPTSEHLFQSKKAEFAPVSQEEKENWVLKLAKEPSAAKAKIMGKQFRINIDAWNQNSEKAMADTLKLKFDQNPLLIKLLLETHDTVLVEYNDWNDTLWGVSNKTGEGKNLLGKLLMQLRTQYQAA